MTNSQLCQVQWSVVVVALVITGSIPPAHSSAERRPNVVIFLADDLGIGDVSCFGNDTIQTPNIDRIARDGAKLTHHLTAAALCTPSRAALLTGRYPVRSGMASSNIIRVGVFVSSTFGLPPNETTFAEVAQRNGYSTALIGKWHLGVNCHDRDDFCHHPLKQGFDYFYGVPLSNIKDFGDDGESIVRDLARDLNAILAAVALGGTVLCLFLLKFRILPTFLIIVLLFLLILVPSTIYWVNANFKMLNSIVMRNYEFVEQPIRFRNFTQRLVNEGVQFLERSRSEDKPFLLMMSWLQVHTLLHTSEEFRGHSKHGPYGDNVEEMDWSVGEILGALERLGILNETFVYFTSDNGGHLEEKGHCGNQEGGWNGIFRGGKAQGSMDGGIRVPTVAMWPGRIPPGTVIDVPTSLMDIFPTLSSAIWSEPLADDRIIDGRNIYPLLSGADSNPPHRFLVHYCGAEIHAARYVSGNGEDVYKLFYATPDWLPGTQGCSFLCSCYHAIHHDPPLLYNIGRDPSETTQLSVIEHADIVARINKAVAEHRSSVPAGIPNQYSWLKLLPNPFLQPCCNFPHCDCADPVYAV